MFQNKINVANGDRKINLSKRLVSLFSFYDEVDRMQSQWTNCSLAIFDICTPYLVLNMTIFFNFLCMLFTLGPGLTSDRYYPPLIKGRLAIIYRLLAMFHPRPFLLTRFGPQGTVACIRAENKDYLDIVFRSLSPFVLYILYANGNIYVNPWFLF